MLIIVLSAIGNYQGPGLIEPPNLPPNIDPPPAEEHGALIPAPPSAWDHLPSLRALIGYLVFALMACGVVIYHHQHHTGSKVPLAATPQLAQVTTEKNGETEQVPMVREAEPAKELIFPHDGESPENVLDAAKEDDGFEMVEANGTAEGK